MRVLYLNPGGQLGGAEISLLDLISSIRLAEPDWELHLVLGEDGPLVERAQELGVKVTVAPFPRALARLGDSGSGWLARWRRCGQAMLPSALYALRLRRELAAIQPDLIHSNGFKMHVLALWARARGTPVIWHVRDYVSSRPLMKRLLRLHARRCAAVLGNSHSVVRDLAAVCGPRVEALCVYNAVDLARFSPAGEKAALDVLAGLAPAPPDTLRIGLIATLARWKGQAVFLRALARLSGQLNYRAYVIGGAIYQTENSQWKLGELRALAAELGIGDRVGFTGFISDTPAAMRALDIIVHASTAPEPFGRVIAEGMACGRAVICSAAGGASELITDGHDALAHSPGDHQSLAMQISKLAGAPELRERLGRSGRATAERRFDSSRLAREIIPVYRRITGQAAPETAAQWAASR